ncbi:MAG: peptidase M16 [Sphingomonadales bacterium 32-68-7]|nr:MAG: peptidase M16 [Sphingomonadales bacterium 32-68-7]
MIRRLLAATLLVAAVPSFAPALAQAPAPVSTGAPAPVAPEHEWPFAKSDLPPDPGYRFGRLANGMRYIIRPNATPAGQGMVQFWVDDGSIAEREDERGFAHFVEHMAFNGSTRVPEGEMIRLLEREGLAFGADTNASTSYDVTLYRLDLPRNDPALLDTAIMLMRETASELTISPEAVEREKGVVLSERRVRDTYQLRAYLDGIQFQYPGAHFIDRLPIGTLASLQGATPEALRRFYQRVYRPENTALVVVGDFDADAVEALVAKHFASWQPAPLVARADPGPIAFDRGGETDIHLDPALAERLTISRHGPALDQTDTLAFRQQNVRRQIAYAIVNRRFQRLARAEDPPFRGAGLGNSDVFDVGRTTQLIVDAGDGEWRRALAAAQAEYRRVLELGFSEAEVAEQVANLRASLEANAAGADTRSNASFVTGAITLLQDGQVPTTPASALQRFLDHLPAITPASVLAAMTDELVPLDNPLIRFEGRTAAEGGAEALRAFANGAMLSLKRTELQQARISLELNVDGGQMLATRDNPLAVAMASVLPVGGLGKHPIDELQSILAGRNVSFAFGADAETFVLAAGTRPDDLELQLQLLAAAVSDPGYRPQGEAQYRRSIENGFASLTATPESALGNALGGIISDQDPRFTLQDKEDYLALSFAKLRGAIADRLDHGAMELALVGDFDEAEAIALVAKTLGALPAREPAFRDHAANRSRTFTADRTLRTLRHTGAADQAIVRFDWPTRDDSDFGEELALELLERVMRIELTDKLREELGQTYSPGVNATQSEVYQGFGYFTLAAQVDVAQVEAARTAMLETVQRLIAAPVADDTLRRARQPMLEAYDSALKTNAGWMGLVERIQRKPERLGRFLSGKERLGALTAADVQAMAARYLKPGERLEINVLPSAGE